jgi:hypothetical protein
LAWRRTGLSLIVCGAAVARGVGVGGARGRPLAGVVVLLIGLGLWLVANRSATRRARAVGTARPAAGPADLVPLALATALAGLASLVVAWSG